MWGARRAALRRDRPYRIATPLSYIRRQPAMRWAEFGEAEEMRQLC